MAKIEYKIYIHDQQNHQRFYSESFRNQYEAREFFKTIKHLATKACIMEFKNDLNTRDWFWCSDQDSWN